LWFFSPGPGSRYRCTDFDSNRSKPLSQARGFAIDDLGVARVFSQKSESNLFPG
jgi:hypothetical protein